MKDYPQFAAHSAARCFACEGTLGAPRDSGNAPGRGAFVADCAHCAMSTWYDVGTAASCTCPRCVDACSHKPGWLKPGDAERIAAYLGVSLEELFRTRLIVDYFIRDAEGKPPIWLLAPLKNDATAGAEAPFEPGGVCAFLTTDGRCSIHPVKPFECAAMIHDEGPEQTGGNHRAAAQAWDAPEHQRQISELLGRDPVLPEPDLGDVLAFLFNPRRFS